MSDSKEAESLQESSPGLEWRSHANPGFVTNKPGALKERRRSCERSPALFQSAAVLPNTNPGSTSLGGRDEDKDWEWETGRAAAPRGGDNEMGRLGDSEIGGLGDWESGCAARVLKVSWSQSLIV